jgi:fatty acid desaturase
VKERTVSLDATADHRAGAHIRINLGVAGLLIAGNLVLFLALPAFLLPQSPFWALLILPILLLTLTHWALIHEAIHGSLLPRREVNDLLARVLCILYGSPFRIVRFGHLSHHALNGRAAERPEFYDPGRVSRWRIGPLYYVRLMIGLYGAELASGPVSLLPRRLLRPIVRRAFYEGRADARNMPARAERELLGGHLAQIRLDALAILLLLGTSFFLYGARWPLLGGALLCRAFVVSVMDNAPHYGGELEDPAQGHDLHLPRPFNYLVLNSNLHGTHHSQPNTPWPLLPDAFAREGRVYSGSYLTVPWRQFKGPIALADGAARESAPRGRSALT